MSSVLAVCLAAVLQQPATPPSPAAELPAIAWHTPDEVGEGWRAAREASDVPAKVRAVWGAALPTWACRGLIDLQSLPRAAASGLAWKDVVRGRAWARPSLARVLVEAHAAWLVQSPERGVAVGDVAQAGCGLVDPGVLTRILRGPAARALLDAPRVAGRPVLRELARGDELDDEPGRFDADAPVLIDTEADAADVSDPSAPIVLARVRRYWADAAPTRPELVALEGGVALFLAHGQLADEVRADGVVRQHWIDGARGRQLVIVRADVKGPFHLADAQDIRVGPWAADRPGAFRAETRYVRGPAGDAATEPPWERWVLVVEGSHATHQTGRDVDLSYPVVDGHKRYVESVAAIDIQATWRWFVLLRRTAESLGVDVDRIFVGPLVYRRLLAEVPEARASRLVKDQVIRAIAGHDDHHHVRIAVPDPATESAALDALGAVSVAPHGTSRPPSARSAGLGVGFGPRARPAVSLPDVTSTGDHGASGNLDSVDQPGMP